MPILHSAGAEPGDLCPYVADLTMAYLSGANLTGANLVPAALYLANQAEAFLSQAGPTEAGRD